MEQTTTVENNDLVNSVKSEELNALKAIVDMVKSEESEEKSEGMYPSTGWGQSD